MENKRNNGAFFVGKMLSGTMSLMLSEATMKLVKLLVLPIMVHYLSPKDFGIIASIKMVQGFLMLLYNPGIISGVSRLYYDTEIEDDRRELIGGALIFFLIFSLLVSFLLIFLGDSLFKFIFNEFSLYPYGIIAIILSVFTQPKRLWSSLMTFQYKITKIAIFSVLQLLIDVGISLYLVVVLGFGLNGRLAGTFIGVSFLFILSLIVLVKYSKGHFSFSKIPFIVKFSLPLAPAIWAYSALDIADRFLIEHYIGLSDLGIYSIAYILSSVPLFFSLGFRKMWTPVFYENMNNEKYELITSLIKIFLVFYSFICAFIIIFSGELVVVVLSKDFSSAKEIIPWVSLGVYFLGLLPISSSFINYSKRFHRISMNAVISAIVNVIINIVLLPRIGVVASAIATFIAYLVYFALNIIVVGELFFKIVSPKLFLLPAFVLVVSIVSFYTMEISVVSFLVKLFIISLLLLSVILSKYFSNKEIAFMKKYYLKIKSKVL